jgi:pimeloyl-ACP methyl ester carboxylesterase
LLSGYRLDQLLTNIMFYVATDKFVSSTWLYNGLMSGIEPRTFPTGQRCETPTGFAAFADPVFPPMPRSFAEEIYNIVHWSEMPRGGHFAAFEQPQLFLQDLRAFARNAAVAF